MPLPGGHNILMMKQQAVLRHVLDTLCLDEKQFSNRGVTQGKVYTEVKGILSEPLRKGRNLEALEL